MTILCDIDGVLAGLTHRLHFLENKNYEAFYDTSNLMNDRSIPEGKILLGVLGKGEYIRNIVLLTSRPEHTRTVTKRWLWRAGVVYGELLMRKDGDHRPSPEVKLEMAKLLEKKGYDMKHGYFIDDDPENVKAICEAYPGLAGITFGVGRLEK